MNKCYSEIIDNIPITRWCPFHDGKISIDNETMNDIDEDTRYTVLEWIKWRIVPAKKFNFHHSSCGIKHRLQEELNIYLTNNQFKHAMLMCGYLPKYENETNWIYAISDKSPCFHSENDKNYMLIAEVARLKKAKRLLKVAVDDINYYVDCYEAHCDECCCDQDNHCHWKHEAEALALIGEDTNVPVSADDINVGDKKDGWISCKDRMPEVNEPVLFIFNTESGFKTVMYGWHETIKGLGSGWHQAGVGGARADEEVTHWQPLPEPPKDGDTK